MSDTRARAMLSARIANETKRLRQVQMAAEDGGESFGLLVTRLAESQERIAALAMKRASG
jgi:hypothetical protein